MADSELLLTKIIEVFSAETDIDPSTLSADTPLESLDVSSFDFLEVVFKIEEKFGVQIDVNTMEGIGTIGELTEIVKKQVEAQVSPPSKTT